MTDLEKKHFCMAQLNFNLKEGEHCCEKHFPQLFWFSNAWLEVEGFGKFCRKLCCLLCLLPHPPTHFVVEDDLKFMISCLHFPSAQITGLCPPYPVQETCFLFSCFIWLWNLVPFFGVCLFFLWYVLAFHRTLFGKCGLRKLRLHGALSSKHHQSLEPMGVQIRGVWC